MKYQINSRLYLYNIIYILIPSLFVYGNLDIDLLKYGIIIVYPFTYYLYNLFKKDVDEEKVMIEENNIKNKVYIIINE